MSRRGVKDWRRAVYKSTSPDRVKVVLLHLADNMRESDLHVSVPRQAIARALGRSERRITERITEAHQAGWLDTVVRGQKNVTAVYQGLFPDSLSGTDARPLSESSGQQSAALRGTRSSPLRDAETRPLSGPNQALSGTPGGPTTTRADLSASGDGRNGGSYDEHEGRTARGRVQTCAWHEGDGSPEDCTCTRADRRRSA